MNQEPHKSNIVLIAIAIIGVIGTVTGAIITVNGNYKVEKLRQETELTRIALVSIATQGGATQAVLESTINAPTKPPASTYTPLPTYTPFPSPTATATIAKTPTPIGFVNEVHQVNGENAWVKDGTTYGASDSSWYSTSIYVKQGDLVNFEFASGEWWIGKHVDNEPDIPQTPIDAGGYTDREEERVIAQMLASNPTYCKEIVSAPIGSLIGRIGEQGGKFFIGNKKEFTATEDGILLLRINYNTRSNFAFHNSGECPEGNGGIISVKITVIPSQ
jgi:type II secretory pathway pseudopilin PulG